MYSERMAACFHDHTLTLAQRLQALTRGDEMMIYL